MRYRRAAARRLTATLFLLSLILTLPARGQETENQRLLKTDLMVVTAHPETRFVLTHFSLRHSDADVIAFFDKENLPNVTVWAHPESLLPEQHQRG